LDYAIEVIMNGVHPYAEPAENASCDRQKEASTTTNDAPKKNHQ
jgi:hypothetical protein